MKPIKNKSKSFKDTQKDLKKKLGLFDKLPEQCLSCSKPFDKTDKEMVKSWYVTVKSEAGIVNLYCKECFETAQKIVKEHFEKKEE